MSQGISKNRQRALLLLYASTAVFTCHGGLSGLLTEGEIRPLDGVAYSFWFSYGLLCLLGLRHPIKMLPILGLQMMYKSFWVLGVGLPLLFEGRLDEMGTRLLYGNSLYVLLDVFIVPWKLVYERFFLKEPKGETIV